MNEDIKVFELADEQLEIATGGTAFPPINVNTQINTNTPVNVNAVGESNVIAFSKLDNSSVGNFNVNQQNPTYQGNKIV